MASPNPNPNLITGTKDYKTAKEKFSACYKEGGRVEVCTLDHHAKFRCEVNLTIARPSLSLTGGAHRSDTLTLDPNQTCPKLLNSCQGCIMAYSINPEALCPNPLT